MTHLMEHLLFTFICGVIIALVFPKLDHENVAHRRYVTFFAMVLFTRYIIWRTQNSVMIAPMPSLEGIWIWICFINEIFIFIETGTFYLLLCHHTNRLKQADKLEKIFRALPASMLPTVDVFIPTYNEGIDVLERTIVGALHLDWPKDKLKVWVLDDGKRDWLQEFCIQKGAGYIRRADNTHAKAGNINHASSLTNGKFVLTLDADFIPYRQFIYRTIGFFLDPKVAIVQTPQHFFTKDFVQTNLHLHNATPDEQRLFFDVMMPARDGWDAAFWCGSCSLSRRTALEECGGVPTTSITEDLLTTLTLLRHGYVTRYLNEKLSHGIAPENLAGLMTQRERWCRGTIQAFYSKEGPLGPNLRFVHRILFFPTYWLFSPVTRIMALIIPIVFLWTGVPSVYIDHYAVLLNYQLPVIIFNFAYEMWTMPGHFVPLINTASNTLNSFQVFPTVINSLFKPSGTGFSVTPKGRFNDTKGRRFYHPYSFWISVILLLLMILGIFKSLNPELSDNSTDAFFPIAATWAVFNCFILLLMIFLSIEYPKKRLEERFTVNYPTTIFLDYEQNAASVIIQDLSLSGAQIIGTHSLSIGEFLHIEIDGIKFPGKILSCDDKGARIAFLDLTLSQRDHMIRFLFTGRFDNAPKGRLFHSVAKGLISRAFGKHEAL